MDQDEGKKEELGPLDSKYYFSLSEAYQDAKIDFAIGSTKDKATSTAKLAGKAAFNIALFSGKLAIETLKRMPEAIEKAAAEKAATGKK